MTVLGVLNLIAAIIGYTVVFSIIVFVLAVEYQKFKGRKDARHWLDEIESDDSKQSSTSGDSESRPL